jgi:hypothetical protein
MPQITEIESEIKDFTHNLYENKIYTLSLTIHANDKNHVQPEDECNKAIETYAADGWELVRVDQSLVPIHGPTKLTNGFFFFFLFHFRRLKSHKGTTFHGKDQDYSIEESTDE